MKKVLFIVLSLICTTAFSAIAATLTPISLLNPVGSTSGQVITSTGAGTAPVWATPAGTAVLSVAGKTGVVVLGVGDITGAAPSDNPMFTGSATFLSRPSFNGYTPYDTGNLNISAYATSASLAPVATLGTYSSLTGLPTGVSYFSNDAGYVSSGALTSTLSNYATTSALTAGLATKDASGAAAAAQAFAIQRANQTGTQSASTITGLASVATSGSYSDLSGRPTIPAAQIQSDWNQTTTTALDYIKNKPTFNYGWPVMRTGISLGTAYQATTPTKAANIMVTLSCPATLTISGSTTCQGEIRIGPSAASVAAGGSGGFAVGPYYNQLTGTLVVGVTINSGSYETKTISLPIGGYFSILQATGTGMVINAVADQTAG